MHKEIYNAVCIELSVLFFLETATSMLTPMQRRPIAVSGIANQVRENSKLIEMNHLLALLIYMGLVRVRKQTGLRTTGQLKFHFMDCGEKVSVAEEIQSYYVRY